MSDLAPFVAAAIRDKVVVDLKEENDKLREQLRQRWAIEIVGSSGGSQPPVTYAKAQFDEGQTSDNFWDVSLTEVQSCPLSALKNVKVFVGGLLKGAFALDNSALEGFFDAHEDDSDTGKSINFFFAGDGNFWFRVYINGWPRDTWMEDATDADFNHEETLEHLSTDDANEYPEATVVFKKLSFISKSLHGDMKSLLQQGTQTQQESEEDREFTQLYAAIGERMRYGGYEGNSFVFGMQLREVVDALLQLRLYERQYLNDGVIDQIIELHERTMGNTEVGTRFQDFVPRLVERMQAAMEVDDSEENDGREILWCDVHS